MTSELCWDIDGLNKDDIYDFYTDIYGFLPIPYIIVHMTCTFYNGVSMAQESINIWVILIQSINVST